MLNDDAGDDAPDDAVGHGNEKLAKTIESLRVRFGRRAVRRMGEEAGDGVSRLPTGFPALDDALGGGLPRGRIVEITGRPTAGMATLALKVVAQAQAQGESAVYLDASAGSAQALEATFDPVYAARCNVILDQLLLIRPANARQAFALLRDFARDFAGGRRGVLVCDLPAERAAEPAVAQALGTALGQSLQPLARTDALLLCLVPLPPGQGEPPPACPASHYASVRLRLRRERWLHRGEDIRGYRAQVVIVKNKMGPAGREITIDITFNGVVQGSPAGEGDA